MILQPSGRADEPTTLAGSPAASEMSLVVTCLFHMLGQVVSQQQERKFLVIVNTFANYEKLNTG